MNILVLDRSVVWMLQVLWMDSRKSMNGHKLMKIYMTKQSVNLKEYTSNMTRFNKKCAQAISFISVGAIKYRTYYLHMIIEGALQYTCVTKAETKPQQTPSVEKHAHPPRVVYCAIYLTLTLITKFRVSNLHITTC